MSILRTGDLARFDVLWFGESQSHEALIDFCTDVAGTFLHPGGEVCDGLAQFRRVKTVAAANDHNYPSGRGEDGTTR
jgi:hypothetical protein